MTVRHCGTVWRVRVYRHAADVCGVALAEEATYKSLSDLMEALSTEVNTGGYVAVVELEPFKEPRGE